MIKFTYTAYRVSIKTVLELPNMSEWKNPSEISEVLIDGGRIKETDAMGREKFWEDLGRPNDDGTK